MKAAEECRYCLDCWKDKNPDTENLRPARQTGADTLSKIEEEAERLWASREKNGFKCLILYHDVGNEWEELDRWD